MGAKVRERVGGPRSWGAQASARGFPGRARGLSGRRCLDHRRESLRGREPTASGTPLPSHCPLLTWGEGAGGAEGLSRPQAVTRAGDRNTQSHGGEGDRGNPPNMASLLGVGEKPDLFLLSSVFRGEGSSEMGRPETSNMGGASGVAGGGGREEGEGWGGRGARVQG